MVLVLVSLPISLSCNSHSPYHTHSNDHASRAQTASHTDGGVGSYSLQGLGFWPLKVNKWPLERLKKSRWKRRWCDLDPHVTRAPIVHGRSPCSSLGTNSHRVVCLNNVTCFEGFKALLKWKKLTVSGS